MGPEDDEPPMRLLTLDVATKGTKLLLRPHNPNRPYVFTHTETQSVLRLGPHLDYFADRPNLRLFLTSKLAVYHRLSRDNPAIGWPATYELLIEVLRLGYPLGKIV